MTSVRPGADVPTVAREFQGHRAGVVTRTLAGGLDYLVVVAVLCVIWLAWAALSFLWDRSSFTLPSPRLGLVLLVGAIVEVVYLTAAWATTGRSVGNQVMGLRVVSFRGRRLGWPAAFLRAWMYTVFPLGLAWAAVSRRNRSLQDMVLHTSVIYDWTTQPEQRR